MAIKKSGPLSLAKDIVQEFGEPVGRNFGAFRVRQTVGDMTLSLDDGIPMRTEGSEPDTTTEIRFSQFYDKRLNSVVLYDEDVIANSIEPEKRVPGAHKIFQNNRELNNGIVNTISPDSTFLTPENGQGSKIILHVTKKLGSNKNNDRSVDPNNTGRHRCAIRTGNPEYWHETEPPIMHINIGPEAVVSGAGGNGGAGGRAGTTRNGSDGGGEGGEDGSSAIGISFPVEKITIQRGGIVRAGGGGGGGGGGAAGEQDSGKSDERVGGAGGGGGSGLPAGDGGVAGSNSSDGGTAYGNVEVQPENGGNGSQTSGGDGGFGGLNNEGDSDETPSAQSAGGGGGGGVIPGQGEGSYGNLANTDKISGFTIRWSGTFVDPGPPPTRDPNGSEARSGQGGGHSFEWAPNISANTALRDATLGWESTSDAPVVNNDVEMTGGSGSNFKVDIKYSPYQKDEDDGTNIFQTAIEITKITDGGSGYNVNDELSTEYWTDNALSPDGDPAVARIINVSEVVTLTEGSGTGGDGNIIDVGAGEDSGKGGDGGQGEAEGTGQVKGNGGEGGSGGYAIITKGAAIPEISGAGTIIGPVKVGDSEIVI